ncbi:MAG: ubiquitin-like domain-containing protein, partial [Candidatus Saccharibacteria bacterium]|nr:ubiquitin-like domain-containing protein [Candidatus Saccharibacteria bacterium]
MRLQKNLDRILLLVTVFVLPFVFAFMASHNGNDTFAESENQVYIETEERFVTFYDAGKKLIVKTDAGTVEEAISRAGIILNKGDIVEPGLSEKIYGDSFFINIYRARPAVVVDGVVKKYVMTASYDKRAIAAEAGLTVYDGDEVKQSPNGSFLEFGAVEIYEITRNGGRNLTVQEEIAFSEEEIKDYNLEPG